MQDPRQELIGYGEKIARAGLVAGAGGNISVRDGGTVWIKPSGFAMDDLSVDDLCGMDLATGRQLQGAHRPTSEVHMHLGIYRVRPDVQAVFHTHSPWASGAISAGLEMKPMFAEFVMDLGRVETVPYVTPMTREFADLIAGKARTCDTLLLVNHGVVAVGQNVKQAFYRVAVVEDAAKSLVAASVVGTPRFFSKKEIDEILALDAVRHRTQIMDAGTQQP
jgi:L-fuculose-phosphate aldolase